MKCAEWVTGDVNGETWWPLGDDRSAARTSSTGSVTGWPTTADLLLACVEVGADSEVLCASTLAD
jgi:hypothetical protein